MPLYLSLPFLFIIITFTFYYLNHFYVVLICISLVICDAEHVSMCLLHILYIFFGEMSVQVLCLLFKQVVWGFLLLLSSCMSSLYILDVNPLLDMTCIYFLPFGRLSFYFVHGFLCSAGTF